LPALRSGFVNSFFIEFCDRFKPLRQYNDKAAVAVILPDTEQIVPLMHCIVVNLPRKKII
jgi:hypothetical protein